MCLILKFIEELNEYLTGSKSVSGNIIRRHTKNLIQLGDLSFPLNIKNWIQIVGKLNEDNINYCNIFEYVSSVPGESVNFYIASLITKSKEWTLSIRECKIMNKTDVHLYLNRPPVIEKCIKDVLQAQSTYGLKHKCFSHKITVTCDHSDYNDVTTMNLTELRASITQDVVSNILNNLSEHNSDTATNIRITLYSKKKQDHVLICGAVLNEDGVKDVKTTPSDLYKKRALDMQLMAQHKYGVQVKSLPTWTEYFEKLGKASVTIEMLQNRIHKAIKITLNNLQSSSKGPSFIFYNCARLSALLKEFENRVLNKLYSDLPPNNEIDFSLLSQPEEWEIVFVYILQFPLIVKSCVCDIRAGIVNPHNLVSFLSNLSSVFSVYYRRVKILTNAKAHLLPVLYARIYFLRAVQQVFHTALNLLNIDPIKEM